MRRVASDDPRLESHGLKLEAPADPALKASYVRKSIQGQCVSYVFRCKLHRQTILNGRDRDKVG